ncbi:MAG: glycosyltransferase family 4 protein, partial [Cetobacterium sp.]
KNTNFNKIITTYKPFNIKDFILFNFFLNNIDYDVYHSLYYSNSFFKKKSTINITTVHDLMYRKVENFFGKNYLKNIIGIKYFDFIVKNTLKNSDYIISVSNTTKEDVQEAFAYDSLFVPEGINKIEAEEKKILTLNEKEFFLYVGNSRPHKNLEFLIKAFEKSKTTKKLVLVGTGNNTKKNQKNILSLGYVSDNELNWLYKNSEAFIFPSLYEGFGLPILEALDKGTKVYSSEGGALKEFPKEVVKYFNPYKEEELITLLENTDKIIIDFDQLKKVLNKYDWKNTKKEMFCFFEKIEKNKK